MLNDQQISDKVCHRCLELYNLQRDSPQTLEKERGIKLLTPLMTLQTKESTSHSLMRSIGAQIIGEAEVKYSVEIFWSVDITTDDKVSLNIYNITGNKWNS